MRYAETAPYEVIATGSIDEAAMQRIKRFARYWDLLANSGRFPRTLPRVLGAAPFERFTAFADALFAATGRTHAIAGEALYGEVYAWLTRHGTPAADAAALLALDYADSGARGRLPFAVPARTRRNAAAGRKAIPERQRRHLRA
jgi:hypothetical protein